MEESGRYKRQADQFMTEGQYAEAVLTYRQALISRPNDPELLSGLGLALAAQGRSRSAAYVLNQAALIKNDDISLKNALAKLVIQPQDGLSLKLAWIATPVEAEPVGAKVAGGRIFVDYAGSRLIALDQNSGQIIWDITVPALLVSPPSADENQVWVGAEDGTIFVYRADSGGLVGSFRTKGAVYAAPALTPDVAFCPSNDGSLYALDRHNLNLLWKADIGEALHVSPLVGQDAIFVGSNDGWIISVLISTGVPLWKFEIPTHRAIESLPAISNGRIFVGSDDGRIYALDAGTGVEYWHYSTSDAVFAQPLIVNNQIIVASNSGVVASIAYQDGSPSWGASVDHPIMDAPVIFEDRLYLATRGDPHLFAVDSQTGKLIGDLNTGDWLAYGPIVDGNGLVLAGKDGAVFLYR